MREAFLNIIAYICKEFDPNQFAAAMNETLNMASRSSALVTDPTWIFFLVLVIILFAPLLLRRIHIPHIIGLILAGIVVGPFGFNILEMDSSFELFGKVGIYYIMFLAGLELNMGSVQRHGRQGLLFGFLTFGIPFAAGLLVGKYILHYNLPTSLLLSCILSSHTLVSYPIVGRYGLGRHRVVVVSVVATAFAIFAALLALALTVGSLNPETTSLTWLLFAGKCVIYGAFIVFGFPRIGRWFLRRFDDAVIQYIFILAMVFLSASLAEIVGLEGLLGAFLAGLALNRLIPSTSPLMNHVEFVGNAFFIPYFLIGVGMVIDVRVMFHMQDALCMTAFVLTGTATKGIAAWMMARLMGVRNGSARLMFGLTNAHAAGALAIVMVGTDPKVNLIDPSMLNGTVVLILFSCIISTLATNKGAKQLALSDTTLEENRGSYHGKCLVTYSQEECVDVMTQLAILIRNPYITDSLMGLSVAYDTEDSEEMHRKGKDMLRQAQLVASAANVQMATLSRMSTNIARGILHTLREYDVGEVIVCLTDRETGKPKTALGNTIEGVLTGSHRELMAVRALVPPGTLRQIIVVVPEKAEYEVGFYKWLEHLCRIGEQTDCRFEFRAHPATMWYIQGYMGQMHPHVRATYQPMPRWSDLQQLYGKLGEDQMLVVVTARPGFISHTNDLDMLPQQLSEHFAETSIMLLYPDQWGDPMESVSVFSPNGTVVTRQPHTLGNWIRRNFFRNVTLLAGLLCTMSAFGQRPALHKMSSFVRRASLDQAVTLHHTRQATEGKTPHLCALVRTSSPSALQEEGCQTLAQWGTIYAADIPLDRLPALSLRPEITRIEAKAPCSILLDTVLIATRAAALQNPPEGEMAYTGKGIVMGVMDIGFDLTHPTFYSRDLSNYRVSAFWDQLDFTGDSTLYVGREYLGKDAILEKAHAADGLQQFHGTHTTGIAAGSGYDSPYIGVAPEADICLVANAVSSDIPLIPEEKLYKYTMTTDLLGFKYIFDYAQKEGKPCVISFSEGSYQDLYGDDQLAYEVLDSLTGPGRILCAAAGNLGRYLTYLHKPQGMDEIGTLLQFEDGDAYYTLRFDRKTSIRLTFLSSPERIHEERTISTQEILACPDSMLIDTVRFEEKAYQLMMAAYPSCYNNEEWATELYLKSLAGEENKTYLVALTLMGRDAEAEAIASGGHFAHSARFPNYENGEFTHSINTPGSAPGVICVGSTSYRTGVMNDMGTWASLDIGSGGIRTSTSSVGPTLMGLVKPDVMAPGMNVISAMSSFYLENHQANPWVDNYNVERFKYEGREYSWNAQSGTSMSCPLAAGIIALWLQACPTLTREQAMEAIAATSRRPEPDLSYPNNEYGYGEINAEAGLHYILSHFSGIEEETSPPLGVTALYDLSGRMISRETARHGVYIERLTNGKSRKVMY